MKTQSKHTPGPWIARQTASEFCLYNEHKASGNVLNVSSRSTVLIVRDGIIPLPEDARLIAAAPDLLEALIEARRVLELARGYFPKSIQHPDRFALLNVLANSVGPAIARATGDQQ